MENFDYKTVEKTGKTVEEAVELALIALDVDKEHMEYEVLEEPSKALFGIFGGNEAKIRAWKVKEPDQMAEEFLKAIFETMGIDANINISHENGQLLIDLNGKEMALLIGRRGQTLDAIQYLISLVVNKGKNEYTRVVLDTENYREKRKQTLENLAQRLARKAVKIRKEIVLEPMNPYERRIIHSTLQEYPGVSTRSEGEEPFRKVIIQLERN